MMPIVAFASDIFAEIAKRKRGRLRGFSVDLGRGVLRATLDGHDDGVEVVQIEGPDFESSVRPRSGALIEWAEHRFGNARMRC